MKRIVFICVCFLMCASLFAQSNPYSATKKKYPLGEHFQKIMPVKVGNWNRFAFHDFVPNQENGTVFYKQGDKQIYVTFGKAYSQSGLNNIWTKIYDNATDGKANQIKSKNTTSTSAKYVLMNSKSGLFYAWTRNLYYFSIEAKDKADADDFMKLFPY